MAIPLSNEQRQVRAPQTADIKAINPDNDIRQMSQAQSSFSSAFGNFVESGIGAKQRYDKTEDAFKRNEAEREYNERTSQLNEELATKEGKERVKFQPKYEAEMKLASDKYESAINKVGDFEIREGSKRSINAWNQRNASNYQYENYKNQTNLQEKSMGQALVTSTRNLYKAITPADNASSVMALLQDPNMGLVHGEQLIRDFYGNRKGMPAEVVDQYVQDYKSKALTLAANRLAELTDQVDTNAAYDQSLDLINSGISQGLINPEEGVQLKRTLEDQKLDMIAETNPGVLINDDGTYNFKAAHRFAPDLTRKEIYKKISSSSKGAGGAGASLFQEQLSQMAVDEWNDMVYKAGWGAELATDDYRERRADLIKGKRKSTGKAVTDLIRFINFGNSELNGVVVVNEDGTYTNPRTGATTQTIGTGVKRVLQKQKFTELNNCVNEAKARLANLMETGSYKDIFTPEVFKAAPSLSDGDRATLANLELLYKAKGGKNDNWLTTKIKNVLEAAHIKHYEATGGVGIIETMSNINGTQLGYAEATKKYGFDPTHVSTPDDDQMNKMVNLKQFNTKTGLYEDIPGMPSVTMGTALNMEIGFATLQQMDDGTFESIYGAQAKKPENVAEMQQYGYQLDFNGGDKSQYKFSSTLNSMFSFENLERVGNAVIPFSGSYNVAIAKAFGLKEPAPFSFSDSQAYKALSKVGNDLRNAMMDKSDIGPAFTDEQFQDLQFMGKIFSGKPDNEPLTYDEFVAQEGSATPDTYTDYLSDRGRYIRTLGTIQSTGATNKNNPGHFFVTTSSEASRMLSDMYLKASGMAPSNPKYIGKDINLKDVLDAGVMTFSIPNRAFNEPSYTKDLPSNVGKDGAPVFFLNRNSSTGYVWQDDKIKMLDCNFDEFVSLLGISQDAVSQEPNVVTVSRGVPASMVSNQFKPR